MLHSTVSSVFLINLAFIDAVLLCTSCPLLEIAKITFQFWYLIGQEIQDNLLLVSQWRPVYLQLIDIIIKHFKYPDENFESAQEREDFRDFRHEIGDILKDSVRILGAVDAISRPVAVLETCRINGFSKWQEVEAPLFALRAMVSSYSFKQSILIYI